jgi:hypothetical protein
MLRIIICFFTDHSLVADLLTYVEPIGGYRFGLVFQYTCRRCGGKFISEGDYKLNVFSSRL